jgi:predicted nucleotidyltransferase
MSGKKEILEEIKNAIQHEIPDAKVYLFGSRANGVAHEESDWDILILTQKKYSKETKWKIQDALFPLSLKLCAYIDIKLIQEEEWNNNPGYYSLKLDLSKHNSLAL